MGLGCPVASNLPQPLSAPCLRHRGAAECSFTLSEAKGVPGVCKPAIVSLLHQGGTSAMAREEWRVEVAWPVLRGPKIGEERSVVFGTREHRLKPVLPRQRRRWQNAAQGGALGADPKCSPGPGKGETTDAAAPPASLKLRQASEWRERRPRKRDPPSSLLRTLLKCKGI